MLQAQLIVEMIVVAREPGTGNGDFRALAHEPNAYLVAAKRGAQLRLPEVVARIAAQLHVQCAEPAATSGVERQA